MTRNVQRQGGASVVTLVALFVAASGLAHEIEHHPAPDASLESDRVEALIDAFRETGNDHYLDDAWQLLDRQLEATPEDPEILILAATVAQARHAFDDALGLIDEALRKRPDFNQAWLLRASVELVRGRTDSAAASCRQLKNVDALVVLGCRSRVAIARGDSDTALRLMTAGLQPLEIHDVDAGLAAWALSIAGDAAAAGRPVSAIDFYERSLEFKESSQVRSALVDRLIAAGRLEAARDVIAGGHAALPLRVRGFIVARLLGDFEQVAEDVARADHRFQHWIEDEDWAHAREMTRFYIDVVDRPTLARRLARINLELQREPEDLLLARRVAE